MSTTPANKATDGPLEARFLSSKFLPLQNRGTLAQFVSMPRLTFDDAHRAKARYFCCKSCVVHDFNDLVDVFVGLGNLFENASFAIATNEDALSLEVFDDSFQITSLFRSGAAEQPAGAMAARPEGLFDGP